MIILKSFLKGHSPALSVWVWAGISAFALLGAASAAEPVLVQGPQGSISAQDLMADAERIPADTKATVLGSAKTVQQMATNLYIRRAFGQEATKLGLGNEAAVKAALQLAQDKVLSDAYLAHLDKQNAPAPAVAESLARNLYTAKPENFKAPEQVQIRHILITTKCEEGRAQAEKLLQELKAGADFSALAKEHSADAGSAAKGGDLGFFSRGQMVPEFENAAFELKNPGDLSAVVPTQFGFHVMQLEARKPERLQSYEEVREALVKRVTSDATQSARVSAADKIRAQAQPELAAIEAFSASAATAAKP